jgi:hypothetical protein
MNGLKNGRTARRGKQEEVVSRGEKDEVVVVAVLLLS